MARPELEMAAREAKLVHFLRYALGHCRLERLIALHQGDNVQWWRTSLLEESAYTDVGPFVPRFYKCNQGLLPLCNPRSSILCLHVSLIVLHAQVVLLCETNAKNDQQN